MIRLVGVLLAVAAFAVPASAQEKLPVLASFSILADLVKNVGGERVSVDTLVGPNADAHVYAPTPADAKRAAAARLVVVNGLGFEGWLERLIKASNTRAPTVVATRGVTPRKTAAGGHGHSHGHSHGGGSDPHAWHSVSNVKIYVGNIRDGLIAADSAGTDTYRASATAYLAELDTLDAELKGLLAGIDAVKKPIVTTHDSFGYLATAYGLRFLSPQGVSTESAISARDVARIIGEVKKRKAAAVFVENVSDPRLLKQIADETGAKIGGTLYSDALTDPAGPAPTYIALMRHNIRALAAALRE